MLGAGTVAPGALLMIAGTSVVHLTHAERRIDVDGVWGPYPNALVDGRWLIEGGQVSAGSVLSWLGEKIFCLDEARLGDLLIEASRREPDASGLVTLDYWMGNRTPYRDPRMRGAILGLSLFHDQAAIYRSAVDSVALASANVIAGLNAQGLEIDRWVVAGGIAKNPLWLQASVDAVGMPAHLVRHENLSLLGAAASAAHALALFDSLESASCAFAAETEIVKPSPAAHERYAEMMELYREATQIVAPITHKLADASLLKSG
jgi:ribulose kinase